MPSCLAAFPGVRPASTSLRSAAAFSGSTGGRPGLLPRLRAAPAKALLGRAVAVSRIHPTSHQTGVGTVQEIRTSTRQHNLGNNTRRESGIIPIPE